HYLAHFGSAVAEQQSDIVPLGGQRRRRELVEMTDDCVNRKHYESLAPTREEGNRRLLGSQQTASASTSRITSSSVCAAVMLMRSRDVPSGTDGGRIAGTSKPRASNLADNRTASFGSPSINGTICVREGVSPSPCSCNCTRSRSARASKCRRRSGSPATMAR